MAIPTRLFGTAMESIPLYEKAALYARVSSELQQKERTIESQVLELKRQIAVQAMCWSRKMYGEEITIAAASESFWED
jgi:predicted site-specific integrase-resolvase